MTIQRVPKSQVVAQLFFSEVRLTPLTVDGEVTILQQLSGYDEEKHVLESIEYWGKFWNQQIVSSKFWTNYIHFPNFVQSTVWFL